MKKEFYKYSNILIIVVILIIVFLWYQNVTTSYLLLPKIIRNDYIPKTGDLVLLCNEDTWDNSFPCKGMPLNKCGGLKKVIITIIFRIYTILIKLLTKSPWTHVGVIIKDVRGDFGIKNEIYMWEYAYSGNNDIIRGTPNYFNLQPTLIKFYPRVNNFSGKIAIRSLKHRISYKKENLVKKHYNQTTCYFESCSMGVSRFMQEILEMDVEMYYTPGGMAKPNYLKKYYNPSFLLK